MADQNDLKDLEDVLEEPEHQLLPRGYMSSDDIRMVTQYLEVSVRGIHEFLRFPLAPSIDPAELEEHLTTVVDLWLDIRVLRYMVIQSTFHAWALLLRRLHESLIRLRIAVHEYAERETGEIVEDHSVYVWRSVGQPRKELDADLLAEAIEGGWRRWEMAELFEVSESTMRERIA